MNNQELFYFTGKCLMLDEHPEFLHDIREKINANAIDWQKFVRFCSNHLILQTIYWKFQNNQLLELLPEDLVEFLKEIYDLNKARNIQILKQITDLTEILNNGNIYPVFLKGASHLLEEIHPDIGARILSDIDFLVPEKDYFEAARLLQEGGYLMAEDTPPYIEIATMKHFPRLSKPGYPAELEVHRLLTETELKWFNADIINQGLKRAKSQIGCFVLSNNHQIVHNFVHSQLSNRGDDYGALSFRDLYDLYLLSNRASLEQVLPAIQCQKKAIAYFAFAREAFGLPETFFSQTNFAARILSLKHTLNHRSAFFYHTHRSIHHIFHKIFKVYLVFLIKAIYSRKVRKIVFRKLTSRLWYQLFFKQYIDFFTGKT